MGLLTNSNAQNLKYRVLYYVDTLVGGQPLILKKLLEVL